MEKSLKKIEEWLNKKGFSLVLMGNTFDWMDFYNKDVYISTRQSKENQLYGLLHECGHILIQSSPKYENHYPVINKTNKNKNLRLTNNFKLETLKEEIEAWDRGKKLAKRLGIKINEEKFDKLSVECLKSYFF